MKLRDVGGRIFAWREPRGVWHVVVGGRAGFGVTFADAFSRATRRAPC